MNLNENHRLESFEVSDDAALYAYLTDVVANIFAGENYLLVPNSDTEARRKFASDSDKSIPTKTRIQYIK